MLTKLKSLFSIFKTKVEKIEFPKIDLSNIKLPKANTQVEFEFTDEGVKVKDKPKPKPKNKK